ncbi:MAG: hypothetical protein GY851_08315 [bacterium]|nr:hypothetical protein [bacterium]
MSVTLFDVQAGFGGPSPGKAAPVGVDDLLRDMERADIGRALVRTFPDDLLRDAPDANRELYATCRDRAKLLPCPIVVPNGAYDMAPEDEQVATAIAEGAGAVTIRPTDDRWDLGAWCSGALFGALMDRRMPVVCSESKIPFGDLAGIATDYPELPLIVVDVQYIKQRSAVPFLRAFPNVYLSMGANYVVYGALELLSEHCDATGRPMIERVLFGTGFPVAEPMAAVTHLMYSGLSDGAKRAVGAGTMERLLEGVVR